MGAAFMAAVGFMEVVVGASVQAAEVGSKAAACAPAAEAECVRVVAASAEEHRQLVLAFPAGHLLRHYVLEAPLNGLPPTLHVPLAIR